MRKLLLFFLVFVFTSFTKEIYAQQIGQRLDGITVVCPAGTEDMNSRSPLLANAAIRMNVVAPTSEIILEFGPEASANPEVQAAFRFAADIIERELVANIPIVIFAEYADLGPGVLASAGPEALYSLTPINRIYPVSLANQLVGEDIEPGVQDINVNIGNGFNFYFGTDGNTPPGQYDFVTIALHEMCHGLGFSTFSQVDGAGIGNNAIGVGANPLRYDDFLENGAGTNVQLIPAPSEALGDFYTSNDLFFNGPITTGNFGGNRPQIYAPNPYQGGSSISHWNEASFPAGDPNSLMSPQVGTAESQHDLGDITRGLFADLGWTLNPNSGTPIPPTAICQDITVQLDASGNATILPSDVDNGSVDAIGNSVTLSLDIETFTCNDVGPNTVTLTVTDVDGLSATCTANVTVEDNIAPTAVCQDITITLDETGNATILNSDVDGGSTDNCGIASLSIDKSSFTIADLGANTVTLTVTDDNDNSSTCEAIVTVEQEVVELPNIVINEIDVDTEGTDAAEFIELYDGGTGNTSLDGLLLVLFNGDATDNASYKTIDLTGLSTNANGFFIVGSSSVPNVDLAEFTTNGIQNGADAIALYFTESSNFPNGTAPTISNLVDAIVYDTNDDDDADLLAALGQSVQFNEDENSNKDFESLSRVEDFSGDFVAQEPTPGELNIISTCEVEIITQPEDLQLCVGENGGSLSVSASGTGSLSYQWQVSTDGTNFNDWANGGATGQNPTLNFGSPGLIANGNKYRVIVTSDNNTSEDDLDDCTVTSNVVTLTVNPLPEVTFTAPANMAIDAGVQTGLGGGSPAQGSATGDVGVYSGPGVTDDGNGMTYSFDPAAAGLGVHTITYTYTNENGCADEASDEVEVFNAAPKTGSITVIVDNEPDSPLDINYTISGLTPSAFTLDDDTDDTLLNGIVFSDVPAGSYTLTQLANQGFFPVRVDWLENEPANSTVDATTLPDIIFNINLEAGEELIVLFTNAVDDAPPIVECPDDIVVSNDAGVCGAIVDFEVNAEDVFDDNPFDTEPPVMEGNMQSVILTTEDRVIASITYSQDPGTLFPVGTTTVTATVVDGAGNTVTCSFDVTVNDTEAPIALCKDTTVVLDESGLASITPADIDGGSTDNCEIASLSIDKTDFTSADVGANTVTLTVTDVNGNTATCEAVVTVEQGGPIECTDYLPNEDPAISLPTGYLSAGADEVNGTTVNTFNSPCAIEVVNFDPNQPWARYVIPINLADYGINPGDRLFIAVDGNDGSGNARFEINQNNSPNTALGFSNFTSSWSHYETTVVVPEGISSLDLWFHNSYPVFGGDSLSAELNGGSYTSYFDNLVVINLDAEQGGNITPIANAGPDQTVVGYEDEQILNQNLVVANVQLDGSASSDPDGTIVSYEWSENGAVLAMGEMPSVILDEGIHTIMLTVTDDEGAIATDEVIITVTTGEEPELCVNYLPNENEAMILPQGGLTAGADAVVGTDINTNNSPCAIEVINNDSGQPWSRYVINISLSEYGINPGDRLLIGVDGNNGSGNARFEINQDNRPNTSLGYSNFGDGWSRYETTITVPEGINSIDLWFHSNYTSSAPGTAYYDNLIVQTLDDEPLDNIMPVASAGTDQQVVDVDDNGAEDVVLDGSGSFDPDGSIVSYSWTENGTEVATGESPTISLAVGTHMLTLTVTDNEGATATDEVVVTVEAYVVPGNCNDYLENDNVAMELPTGGLTAGADAVVGTDINTNNSSCAVEVTNTDAGQPWSRYFISINLSEYGINAGDRLFIGVDGNNGTGNARFEINQNNRPNTALGYSNFGDGWSRYETTIVVPSGLTTIDLWFHSNYTLNTSGTAYYDNLEVVNLDTEVPLLRADVNNMFVSPNPASISSNVSFEKPEDIKEILLFDMSGRMIQRFDASEIRRGDHFEMNIYAIPVGTYIVRSKTLDGMEYSSQMVIER
ncbi:hypothetical protein GCM10011414_28630 [Croceivirga lutea]|uniref:PKD domain-containing protein n=1 Tax=Croceivirga lutea TaxID=1775167 RepID=UPI00163A08E2|nr:HYR domain-containing protein [Croceivirga lutea]GGG57060.1 hypothetical protein GCM10011414_28630 [Croceivirga lutea]